MIINTKEKPKIEEKNRECLWQWSCLGEALLRSDVWSLREVREGAKWGKKVPDKVKNKWKGLEHGVCLMPLRYRKEVKVSGVEGEKRER